MDASHGACALFNYSPEEIRGILVCKIINNKSVAPSINNKTELRAGFGIKKDKVEFPIEYKSYFSTGENTGSHVQIISILNCRVNSAKADSNQTHRSNNFQFSRLFNENPSAGWIVDQKSLAFLG